VIQKISLLGPLEIESDGQAAEIMKSKQGCALLSYLLVTRRVHSRESIAALIWDGPSTPDTLRYLRKLLYRLGPLLPELQVSRHQVAYTPDDHVAVDLYTLTAALAGSDIESLAEALMLYRGELLAGFHLPEAIGFAEWLAVERERLRRLAADGFRTVCDAYAASAHWQQGIAVARRWLMLDPLDEEAQRRLMEFLAADGQIAAALSQFESLRSRLWSELEVTPELATVELVQRLEQLKPANHLQLERTHDEGPQVDLPEPGTLPVPGMLPARSVLPHHYNAVFIGRSTELLWLAERLLPGRPDNNRIVRTVAVTGMGGLGKTQLAVEYAYRYGRYYPGGVYWIGFADGESVPEGIAALGGERGMRLYRDADSFSLAECVARVQREWQEPISRLLIFDNCEDEGLAMQWLPVSGGCSVLMTSRRSEWTAGLPIAVLSLNALPRAESAAFLERVVRRISAEDAHLIAEEVGDLPLALHLAAQFLKQHASATPHSYLAQLRAGNVLRHASFRASSGQYSPTHHEMDVERTFMVSFRQLSAHDEADALALKLLASAACYAPATPIPQSLLLASAGVNGSDVMQLFVAENAILRLVNLGLLNRTNSDSVSMHRLIGAFARETLSEEGGVLSHIAEAVARTIVQAVSPSLARSPYQIKLPCSVAHLRYILGSVHCVESRWFVLIAAALGQHLDMIADYEEAQEILEQAIHDSEALADPRAAATTEFLLARTMANRGFDGDALAHIELAEAALHRGAANGELHLADVLSEKGWIASRLGDVNAAMAAAGRSYELNRESGDISGMIEALNLLGVLHYYMMEEYGLGTSYLEHALELLDRNKISQGRASVLANLGESRRLQGHYEQALALHEAALQQSRLAGNRTQEFMQRNNLHGTQAEAGMYRAAVAGLEALIEEVPTDWRILPETYGYLAEAYLGARQLRPAQEAAQLALAHAEATGNPRDLAGAWQVMARVVAAGGSRLSAGSSGASTLSARDCYAESLKRYTELNLRRDVAITLWHWAECELAQGDVARGTAMVRRARELFTTLKLSGLVGQMADSLAVAGFSELASLSRPMVG